MMQNLTLPSCVASCNLNKTVYHLFFDCHVFKRLWMNVLSYLEITCVLTNNCCHGAQLICLVSQ